MSNPFKTCRLRNCRTYRQRKRSLHCQALSDRFEKLLQETSYVKNEEDLAGIDIRSASSNDDVQSMDFARHAAEIRYLIG